MRKSIIAMAAFALTSTTALAADYSEPAPAFSWTGFYVGAFASYTDVNRDWSIDLGGTPVDLEDSFDGFSGGALLGFNYQFDSVVVGLEGDVAFASLESNESLISTIRLEDEIDMTYGVRARLGYAVDHTLLFVTGGVAWADYKNKISSITGGTSADLVDETLFGWQFGGGVEQAVTDNITVRLEYLYTDYEDADLDATDLGGPNDVGDVDLDSHSIRLGVNFLFNAF